MLNIHQNIHPSYNQDISLKPSSKEVKSNKKVARSKPKMNQKPDLTHPQHLLSVRYKYNERKHDLPQK